jgi:hypothetical protein
MWNKRGPAGTEEGRAARQRMIATARASLKSEIRKAKKEQWATFL